MKKYLFLFLFLLSPGVFYAQEAHVLVDKKAIYIGEPIKYNLRVNIPMGGFNMLVKVPEDMQNFEVLDAGVSKSGDQFIEQTLTLTSFDSGAWLIPPFEVVLTKQDQVLRLNTKSVQIKVDYLKDEPARLHDIKSVFKEKRKLNWLYIISAALLLALVAFILSRYFRKKTKDPVLKLDPHAAYKEAMQELQELRKLQHEPKRFHFGISEVFKKYLHQSTGKQTAQLTTDELLLWLSEVHKSDLSDTASVLRLGDAVKFARFIPGENLQTESLNKIQGVIENLHKVK